MSDKQQLKVVLLFKQKWAEKVLDQTRPKTWEIRGTDCIKYRSKRIGIACAKHIHGETKVVKTFQATKSFLSRPENQMKHQISNLDEIKYKKIWVWELMHSKKYDVPIKYEREKSGCVTWQIIKGFY